MLQFRPESFLDSFGTDVHRHRAMGWHTRLFVMPQEFEEKVTEAFFQDYIRDRFSKDVFDIREHKGKPSLYLYNVRVMFTKRPCKFYYLLEPMKEAIQ